MKKLEELISESGFYSDCVIVGAGIAGLSTAYYLLEKEIEALVIEKDYIGAGATSKSSGLLCSSTEWDLNELIKEVDTDKGLYIWNINAYATRLLVDFIIKNNINCELRELNSIYFALDKPHVNIIREEAEVRKIHEFKVRYLDKRNIKEIINTEKFYAGLYSYGDHTINPKPFINQLGTLLRKYGINIIENTEALKIDEKNKIIKTNKGLIRYNKLILANNYHVMKLGFFKNIIHPLRIFTGDSYPLPDDISKKIGWQNKEICWDSDLFYTYFYLKPNNCIHIGGGKDEIAISEKEPPERKKNKIKFYFEKYLDSMFSYVDIKIDDIGSGILGLTKDEVPIIGKSKKYDDIYFVISAPGLALSFLGGEIIAELITTGKSDYQRFFDPDRNFGLFNYAKMLPTSLVRSLAYFYGKALGKLK